VIDTLPIKGGRSSLHKTLAVSLVSLALLVIIAVFTTQGEAASPGDLLYVCNGNNVTVLNATDLSGVRAMSFGSDVAPSYIALSPGGTTAYIISVADDRLLVVDIARATITNVITMAAPAGMPGAIGSGITVSADGKRIYVTDNQAGLVRVINTSSYTVIANISVGSYPIGLTISPNGHYAYVANSGSGTVSVIDTSTNAVIGNVAGGNGTFDVRISPDGGLMYVSSWYGGDIKVYDAYNGSVKEKIQVNPWISPEQGGINNIRLSPDGKTLYVANAYDGTIALINTNTKTIFKTIPVGGYPREMELSPDGSQLYVSLINDRKVCMISLPAGNVTYQDMSPVTPLGLAYYSSIRLPTPTPTPINSTVTVTPAPTPSFAPTATPTPEPTDIATPTPRPPLYYLPGKTATIKPTQPAVSEAEASIKPYFTGWTAPELNIGGDNLIIIGIGGLLLFLVVLGTIAYISVRRKMRGPDEDEYEYEDED
jgi:YVTN family beta-propeller protein